MHYDPYDNFLLCVVGKKYVRLFPPGEPSLEKPETCKEPSHMSDITCDITLEENQEQLKRDHPQFEVVNSGSATSQVAIDFFLEPGIIIS